MTLIGKTAKELQLDQWVQGDPVKLKQLLGTVILIEVFQVNCPGCFLHSLPQAIDLYQRYSNKGLNVLGIATAFEDYDKNTLNNLKRLVENNEVFGETLKVLQQQNKLVADRLAYHIPFPVAMDKINKHHTKISNAEITHFINQQLPDFRRYNSLQQKQIQQQAFNYLESRLYTAETFRLYALQGTPSHIIIDKKGIIRGCEFGYFTELEWLITTLLEE
ncbi:MAG: TlpA family protein disulfide reductase [Methylococcales symbiont of Hymedesmia sp. n. MRB-2018]|nr:MAG: TlpA family protein disulfide reductase [Methylococcales symbiont of Hymedesmia sp. n. MRB-2018]